MKTERLKTSEDKTCRRGLLNDTFPKKEEITYMREKPYVRRGAYFRYFKVHNFSGIVLVHNTTSFYVALLDLSE